MILASEGQRQFHPTMVTEHRGALRLIKTAGEFTVADCTERPVLSVHHLRHQQVSIYKAILGVILPGSLSCYLNQKWASFLLRPQDAVIMKGPTARTAWGKKAFNEVLCSFSGKQPSEGPSAD